MSQDQMTPEEQQLMDDVKLATEQILKEAEALSLRANSIGFVLTIETLARPPLAMGNYDCIATLRLSHDVYRGQS